jgi:DNA-binding NarL/FixJ family response regulator
LRRREPLRPQEAQVLEGVYDGLTGKEIAASTGLSAATVKNVVHRLYRRAGVRRRSQLVRAAFVAPLTD